MQGSHYSRNESMASVAFHGHVLDSNAARIPFSTASIAGCGGGIRKAQNAGLRVQFSTSRKRFANSSLSIALLDGGMASHRNCLQFFHNIARYVLAEGNGFIATARLGQKPLAASVFFYSGSEAIYKFGASDYAFQKCDPITWSVMWEAIKRCAANGFARLNLGRTSLANEGLRQFKRGFGAREEKNRISKIRLRETVVREQHRSR